MRNKLHQIWIQDKKPLPEPVKLFMHGIEEYCLSKNLSYKLHDNSILKDLEKKSNLDNINIGSISDLARYYILSTEGGTYLDVDTELINSNKFLKFPHCDICFCKPKNGVIDIHILGAYTELGKEFFKCIYDACVYNLTTDNSTKFTPVSNTGPLFFKYCAQTLLNKNYFKNTKIAYLPAQEYAPLSYPRTILQFDPREAGIVHHFAALWQ